MSNTYNITSGPSLDEAILAFPPNIVQTGDIVEGTIVQIDDLGAFVEIGAKFDGWLPAENMANRNFEVGHTMQFHVVHAPSGEGNATLTL